MKTVRIRLVLTGLWLALIFTLYMAPSEAKYYAADLLSAVMLIALFLLTRPLQFNFFDVIKPLASLVIFIIYAAAFIVCMGGTLNSAYLANLLAGFLPYLLLYVLFRNQDAADHKVLVVGVFVIPGMVHLVYMYIDIYLAIQSGKIEFLMPSTMGFLEAVKGVPRVGRRYVSIALLHLLFGCSLMAKLYRLPVIKYGACCIAALGILSLALLDARAAYTSLIIGALLLFWTIGIKRGLTELNFLLGRSVWRTITLVVLMASVVTLAYSTGVNRWISVSYSLSAAATDVFSPISDIASRRYVDKSYWSAPIENIEKCYREEQFRCKIDQSAYLRAAWSLEGMKSIVDHPFGIGYSDNYMGRLWGVVGDDTKYQRVDSFLIEQIVSFGIIGIFLYACLWYRVARTLRRALQMKHAAGVTLTVVAGIIFVCVGRSLVDVFSEGLWRYLMALLGMYYGLLHSRKIYVEGE